MLECQKTSLENKPYGPRGAARELFFSKAPEILLEGPAGCVGGETRLYDPVSRKHVPIRELHDRGIAPIVLTMAGPRLAEVPFLKGFAPLFELSISGRACIVTADHKVLAFSGWRKVGELKAGDAAALSPSEFAPSLLPSISDTSPSTRPAGARHLLRRERGFRVGCLTSSYLSHDGRLRTAGGIDLVSFPSQGDVREHIHGDCNADAEDCESGYIRACPSSDRLSMMDCSLQSEHAVSAPDSWSEGSGELSCCSCRSHELSGKAIPRLAPSVRPSRDSCGTPRRDRQKRQFQNHSERSVRGSMAGQAEFEPTSHGQVRDTSERCNPVPAESNACTPSSECLSLNNHCRVQWGTVSSVKYVRSDYFYDLHVPVEEHYLAEGIWHHNTGKTLGVLEYINKRLLDYPRARALIARKTRTSMTESVLVTFEGKVIPDNPELYPLTGNVTRMNRQAYHYPNGSSLVVGGLDKPERIMSTEYDIVAIFEATEATENDWELCTSRLRNYIIPEQQAIADCNPGPPSHWLNRRAHSGLMQRLRSRHEDNPLLYDRKGVPTQSGNKYLSTLSRLTGHRLLRLKQGIWAASEGLVYENFDADIHVVKRFPVPSTWRRIRMIDFGYTNPFVCLWGAVDPDGRLYIYRELYMSHRLVEDHAKQIIDLSKGEKIESTISDHDAEDRATLHKYGVHTIPARKEITVGIETVTARLRDAGDGKPRLFLMENSLVERDDRLIEAKFPYCLEQEMDSYMWPKGQDGKSLKEEPVDKDNHGQDALRYGVMHLDRGVTIKLAPTAVAFG